MDLIPLISIPIIYLLTAFLKPYFQPKLPFNICSICVAVSASWFILLVLWLTGYDVTTLPISILMGMSITGIMYKLEDMYKKKKIQNFWFVRLVIIVGGFYAIYLLLQENWDLLLLIAIAGIFALAIPTLLFQNITHKDVKKASVIKRLDDCC